MKLDQFTLDKFISQRLDVLIQECFEIEDYHNGLCAPSSPEVIKLLEEAIERIKAREQKTI